MCGINGIYRYNGLDANQDAIRKMNELIAKRGPDAEGIYQSDNIHLGHTRLAILNPGEESNQPFSSQDGRYTLIFNGEIYNYQEIKNQLTDYNFKTSGDTEVVLAAYMKWGANCLRSFNGMFAFAIWDDQLKELFISRDRLGIKPLYYHQSEKGIIFSSSVRSVLATNEVPREIDPESLVDYLRYQTVHAPKTIVKGIKSLMPGNFMRINEEGLQIKSYWSLTDDVVRVEGNKADIQKNVRKKLEESVNRRLVADVPFGAFLSGGIDSSIIVAFMSQQMGTKLDTFSVVFKENEFSEAPYAKLIAEQYQTNHHEIELSVNEFKELIPEALSNFDHPSGDGPNTYVVSQKTRSSGIKMALSGLGGDELFGGYSIFKQAPELMQKSWLRSFPVYGRKHLGSLYHMMKGSVESAKIKEIMRLEEFDLEYIYQFYRQVLLDDQVQKLLNTSESLPQNKVLELAHDLIGYQKPGWRLSPLSRISAVEMATYMQNVLLRDTDQMSMANGLEVRVPFLDHELVSFVMGIPDQFKKPVTPKKLLVDACSDLIPESIYDRPKMGFVLPYEHWMKNELKDFCQERLNELKKIKYFHGDQLDALWNQFLKGNKRVTWSRIWPLVVLGDWIKTNGITG